ncbi:MAG: hypothetical protein JW797_13955 [Bradymonadales bacterium]|nr:hypothetical protein [Bradymonadales bacterium]
MEQENGRSWEFPARIIFGLLRPAVRIARHFNLSLKKLSGYLEMAYIDQLQREEKLSNSEIGQIIDKSMRTVGYLLQRYRGDFLVSAEDTALLRTVEAEILRGSQTRTSLESILQANERDRLPWALRTLCESGRVHRLVDSQEDRYEVSNRLCSWVSADIERRIDGLNHQMEATASAVFSRFIREDNGTSAVRTYSFLARSEQIGPMIEQLIQTLRAQCIQMEEEALEKGDGNRYLVTFALAPEWSALTEKESRK